MSIGPTPPRRSSPARRRRRELFNAAFRRLALAATLFGLAMLVIFFVRLGQDVVRWFAESPAAVGARNQELAAQVEQARSVEERLHEHLRQIEDEGRAELAAAPDEAARKEIRRLVVEARRLERENVEQTARELLAARADLRPDTSPPALVWHFFTAGPSPHPQDAGIRPALLGSLTVVFITLLAAVPLGVGAAIYLEEYGQKRRLARLVQVNITNLAGVPSVLYGILGAWVFVEGIFRPLEMLSQGQLAPPTAWGQVLGWLWHALGRPDVAARNVLGGGLTLALLTLPIIIVSAQEAIRAVPSSLRAAAFALGATRWQVVWRVVLPPAMPGMLTGMILALSRALGEAAPLLLFGALLYVNHDPSLFGRFTVLPMQIFGWSDRPAEAWRLNAALASAVLVGVLLLLNAAAITLRHRWSKRVKP